MKIQKTKTVFKFPLRALAIALIMSFPLLQSCSDDEEPEPENEEELITTLTMTFTNAEDASDVVTASFRDLDGDGGNAPVITNPTFTAGARYNATIELLNETETPAEDITEEVEEEGEEHQFFFAGSNAELFTFSYTDEDASGNPIGITTTWTAGDAGTGTLVVILRHEPDKNAANVSSGDITNAGGETDIEVSFDATVE